MVRSHVWLTLAALVVAGSLESWAQPAGIPPEVTLEQHLIESASTPADHEALAKQFHADADKLRMMALAHRSMGDSYRRSKLRKAEEQKEHCERIAALEERISAEYESLSREHEAQVPR